MTLDIPSTVKPRYTVVVGRKQNGTVYRGARYIEVHLSYIIHGWGNITMPGISRFTVYRGTVYRGLTVPRYTIVHACLYIPEVPGISVYRGLTVLVSTILDIKMNVDIQ